MGARKIDLSKKQAIKATKLDKSKVATKLATSKNKKVTAPKNKIELYKPGLKKLDTKAIVASKVAKTDKKVYKTKEEIAKLPTLKILGHVLFTKNQKGPGLHGNYCGPFHGDLKKNPVPVDTVDCGCKKHDIEYGKYGYFSRIANNNFIAYVDKNAHKMTPAERELAYYYAEGFRRMNKTPLQEIAKVGGFVVDVIKAPLKAGQFVVNAIKDPGKTFGTLFNKSSNTQLKSTGTLNRENGGSSGNNNLKLLKKRPLNAAKTV